MFDPTRPVLVATGDKHVDHYLRVARETLHFQRALEDAETALTDTQKRYEEYGGDYGTAEARQRAEKRLDDAAFTNRGAWAREQRIDKRAAAFGDPVKHGKAEQEIEAMWEEFYSDKPATWPRKPITHRPRHH